MSTLSGIDHIDIVVRDPEAMAAFLESVGFTMHRRTAEARGSIELRFPGEGEQPILELTPHQDANGNERPLGLRHLALGSGDINALFESFKSKGLAVKGEPRVIPDTGRTLFNVIDPEGGTLQFVDA